MPLLPVFYQYYAELSEAAARAGSASRGLRTGIVLL